jgi:hypothetical protein
MDMQQMLELLLANQEKAKTHQARMEAKMNCNQTEMRFTVCAFRCELEETIQREMRAAIQSVRSELDETTACREATETEPDPGTMQSI